MSRAQSIRDKFAALVPDGFLQVSYDATVVRLPDTFAIAVFNPKTWTWDVYPSGLDVPSDHYEVYTDQRLVEDLKYLLDTLR